MPGISLLLGNTRKTERGEVCSWSHLVARAAPFALSRRSPVAAGGLLALILPLAGWPQQITREGSYWVQTVSGAVAVKTGGRIRISTRGPVTVSGGNAGQVEYDLTRKVRARSPEEARRLLEKVSVAGRLQGDVTSVKVIAATSFGFGAAILALRVPKAMRQIMIETYGGAVAASGLSGDLDALTGGGRIQLDEIGGSVQAKTAGGEIQLGSVGGSVRCISAGGPIRAGSIGGDARLETAGGDIVIRAVKGRVSAVTNGGGILIGQAGATVAVNTAGGAIEVGSARGTVTAESLGGPILVSAASGVHCETAGGAIRLENVSGNLRAATAMGNISASLAPSGAADSFLSTGSGDITVFVPSNLGIRIEAHNDAAQSLRRIVSDFPDLTIRRQGPVIVAEGVINGGGPLLRLAGAGGTIYIRRQQ